MMPEGTAALPHFILLSALWIWVADTLGGDRQFGGRQFVGWEGGGGCWGSSLLGHSNSTLRGLAESSSQFFILSSSVSASSPASLHKQFLPITSWFVWSICLAIRKTPSPSGDTVANSSFSAQTLQAAQNALPCAWRSCRRSLPLWPQLSCLPSSGPCRL